MHKFDYSFLENGNLHSQLLNVALSVYELRNKEKARKDTHIQIFTELEKIAKIQSVKSSNAIEGIVTTDDRIKAIVNKNVAPLNHNEAEIAGYRDALNFIHNNYQQMDFDENAILFLHKMLFSLTGNEEGGKYKNHNNLIMELDKDGKRKIRFEPIPFTDTKIAMEQLVLAYIDAQNNSKINRLLLIPCVIFDFLCIHPFADGNGRMSRLLTLLLLYKNDFDAGKYISFEEQINKYKDLYYDALEKSSQGWHENTSDYYEVMFNFLSMLYLCYKELDKRFAIVNGKKITKKARVEATVLNSLLPISKKEICEILPDVSPTTVEAVLGKMVKNSQIKKIGAASQTKYYKN